MRGSQSVCAYSSGSAVVTSVCGARRSTSSKSALGGRPATEARSALMCGMAARVAASSTVRATAASRSRPTGPRAGLRPGPNGGPPRERSTGV